MSCTKKDYEAIAEIFRRHGDDALSDPGDNGGADIWTRLRDDIAYYFMFDNSQFNLKRFVDACDPGA